MTNKFGNLFLNYLRQIPPGSRFRLAPTPSGFLHLGNGVNFLLNALAAGIHTENRLLLRIDDLDQQRVRAEYLEDIFSTLHWMGIIWDEGPANSADFQRNWSQNCRKEMYQVELEKLKNSEQLFACGKSRSELAGLANVHYPDAFRSQNLTLEAAEVNWRIKTPAELELKDFIVRKRDGNASYQLANIVDDVYFQITHIIRGADLHASTQAQLYLANILSLENFGKIQFLHHPLMLDASGQKLSKSAGAASLSALRSSGQTASSLIEQVHQLLFGETTKAHNLNMLKKIVYSRV